MIVSYINQSPSDVFPGGTYRNYAQIYVPSESSIDWVFLNEEKIVEYDVTSTGYFKIVGLFISIPPLAEKKLTVSYTLNQKAKKGINNYQVIVQKQIGALNDDFIFEMKLSDNTVVTNQNFASLAKNNSVVYNSTLSTDRIFIRVY